MTKKEIVIEGLEKRREAELEVKDTGLERGRGLFATAVIQKGRYVCEYRTGHVYRASQKKKHVAKYNASGDGDYILEARTGPQSVWMCYDATRAFHQFGRYANHSLKRANMVPSAPVYVRGKYRIGFTALQDIQPGEELFWDYGDRKSEMPWLKNATAAGYSPQKIRRREPEEPTAAPTVSPEATPMVKPKDSMPGPQPEEPTAPKVSPKARAKQRKPASSKSKQRFYRLCPLGGCRLQHKPKQKLSKHIKVEHPEIDRDQWLELVRKAAIVRPDTIKYKQPPRQSSILSFFKHTREDSSSSPGSDSDSSMEQQPTHPKPPTQPDSDSSMEQQPTHRKPPTPRKEPQYLKKRTTLDYPRFSNTNSVIVGFTEYLISLDGGKRSAENASEIAVDVSIYLHFANPEACDLKHLLDDDSLKHYISQLEATGIGPDGIVTKLGRIVHALRYLAYLHRKEDSGRPQNIDVVIQQIMRWKTVYSKQKKGLAAQRLSSFAAEGLTAADIPNVSECPNLVRFYADIVKKCETKTPVSPHDLSLATAFVAAALAYKNLQRAGAAVGMKLRELAEAQYKERGDHQYLVITVKEHKTASSSPAKIVVKDGDITVIRNYQKVIRPCITNKSEGYFLVNAAGEKISHLNQLLQRLDKVGDATFPTLTQARKVGATEHTRAECSYTEAAGLSRHMSHTLSTSHQYYQANVTAEEHIDTFERISSLGKRKTGTPPPLQAMRRAWTAGQTQSIELYFNHEIESGKSITLLAAREFLAQHEMPGRTPKSIQDKVRTFTRKRKSI